MNFAREQEPALEAFRREVGDWLDQHAPADVRVSRARALQSPQVRAWARGFQQQLADKGWAAPSWPREFGGGSLTPSHDAIVQEELDARQVPQLYVTNRQVAAALLTWGSAAQCRQYVRPLLRGEISAWKSVTESDAIADPDGVFTQAVKDGDVYVVSGEEVVGGADAPGYFWLLAVTDPLAPAQARLSAFLVPADLPGIIISNYESLAPDERSAVVFDDVGVPVEYRVGAEGAGWVVAQSVLSVAVDTDRLLHEQQAFVGRLVAFCQQKSRTRRSDAERETLRERAAEAYIDLQVLRLLSERNQWMQAGQQETTYHAAQYTYFVQTARERLAGLVEELLGPLALVDDPAWTPLGGDGAALQQAALPGLSGGDDAAASLLVIGKALGLVSNAADLSQEADTTRKTSPASIPGSHSAVAVPFPDRG